MDSSAARPFQRAGGVLTRVGRVGRCVLAGCVLTILPPLHPAGHCCSKSNMSHPTKSWGFWRTDKHNGKYELNADPAVSKLPGRRAANLAE